MFSKSVDGALKRFYKALNDLKEVARNQGDLVDGFNLQIDEISAKKKEAANEKIRAEKVITQIEAIIQ
jgi:hypothetical protein